MKLPKLHVFKRNIGTRSHAHAIAGINVGIGRGRPNAASTTRCHQDNFGLEDVELARFHFQCGHANNIAFVVSN